MVFTAKEKKLPSQFVEKRQFVGELQLISRGKLKIHQKLSVIEET